MLSVEAIVQSVEQLGGLVDEWADRRQLVAHFFEELTSQSIGVAFAWLDSATGRRPEAPFLGIDPDKEQLLVTNRDRPDLVTNSGLASHAITVTSGPVKVLVIQHGDKKREPGDPGLTALGHEQAAEVAAAIEGMPVGRILCSPYRRARETAAPIEAALGMRATIDARLRERMNWEGADQQPLEEFLQEWELARRDRGYTPSAGDSSAAAGRRFVEVLDEQTAGGTMTP